AVAVVKSGEYRFDLSQGYYQKYLGRSADAGGLQHWMNLLALGGRQEDVVVGILGSSEYFARNGSDNNSFVQALYHDLLGRTASQGEVDGWVAGLGVASRGAIAMGFLSSDEYRTILINGWYHQYLGRDVDSSGLATW